MSTEETNGNLGGVENTPVIDYKKRFEDTQAALTKKNQELAELKKQIEEEKKSTSGDSPNNGPSIQVDEIQAEIKTLKKTVSDFKSKNLYGEIRGLLLEKHSDIDTLIDPNTLKISPELTEYLIKVNAKDTFEHSWNPIVMGSLIDSFKQSKIPVKSPENAVKSFSGGVHRTPTQPIKKFDRNNPKAYTRKELMSYLLAGGKF
jgi:hypothetical protein